MSDIQPAQLAAMLKFMVQSRASDLHFRAGRPPMGRVDGDLKPLFPDPLTAPVVGAIAHLMMSEETQQAFDKNWEADFAYSVPGVARFRVNVFKQRGSVAIVMRVIGSGIPTMAQLGLPAVLGDHFALQERGLILVTGPTGSGKTTTLSAFIDHLNDSFPYHILTLEDPIEVLYQDKKSIVAQREIGNDSRNFSNALRAALRQDPDVILIGEMRDKETVEAALSAAGTGHLVLSTLHTMDAPRTIQRVIDFFPPHERPQIRQSLSEALVGICSQRLLAKKGGGRVLGMEVMVGTPMIKDIIKDEDRTPELKEAILDGAQYGMRTFDQHVAQLYADGVVEFEDAMAAASSPSDFKLLLTKSGIPIPR